MARWHRRLLPLAGLLLVATACFGGSGDSTTTEAASTTAAPVTTVPDTTSTTLIANGTPLVSEGDRNETVAAFQFLLNCNGFGSLVVDGVFGPASQAAVEAAQVALGRETTGAPDEETLALLSRDCADSRRIETEGGRGIAVGNVGPSDPDRYLVRSGDTGRIAAVVVSDGGIARLDVGAIDGTPVAGGSAAVAGEVVDDVDYAIQVMTVGEAATYALYVSVLEPPAGAIAAADPGTINLGGREQAVAEVCLDTTGEAAYVAETATGYLVIATGAVGTFGPAFGGIGAAVEFVTRGGPERYHAFSADLTIAVGERVIGSVPALPTPEGPLPPSPPDDDEPLDLAFDFLRSVAPCAGGAVTPIVLTAEGLGVVAFGTSDAETVSLAQEALPGASPLVDTGWISIDPQANPFGVCAPATTEVRVVEIDNLTLFFTDAPTTWRPAGGRHFVAYQVIAGAFPLLTRGDIGPGSSIAEVLAAHSDAVAVPGPAGGVDVFVSSPPGSEAWLRATAAGASDPDEREAAISAVVGGRFCDI